VADNNLQTVATLILFFLWNTSSALAENYIFISKTEDSTKGWKQPSEDLSTMVVGYDKENKELINEKIKEDSLDNNYRQFLVEKLIPLSKVGNKLFLFVRPKSDVYSAFYGAHSYRHFVINTKDNSFIFSRLADYFMVSKNMHHGMRDIVSGQCFGGYCNETKFIYDAELNSYIADSCIAHLIVDEKTTRPCGDGNLH
jgi:hypothetical protein